MRIIGIDPGGTTGIAILDVKSLQWRRLELGPVRHHLELWHFLDHEVALDDIIVCESFEYRIVKSKGTEMPHVELISRNYIGVVELYSAMYPQVRLVMQTPSQGGGGTKHAGFWKNDKLKTLGLYTAPGGRQHMNDATRHVLHYVTFTLKDDRFVRRLK